MSTQSGFPCANPTPSQWQLPPHPLANHRTTAELPTSIVFDHVIVGSGISGAAIAYKLLSRDPNLSILMLEARTAASGASGRNGGHCRAGYWLYFKDHVDQFGEDEALKFERMEEQNVPDIADFIREHDIECEFQQVETSHVYRTEAEWNTVLETIRFREEVHRRRPDAVSLVPRRVLRGVEAQQYKGMPNIVGAVLWSAHTQNPYRLVCRVLEMSIAKGMNLQTQTLVTSLEANSSADSVARWHLVTNRGTVHTKNVVLATNGYTNTLHAGLAATKFLVPGRSQVAQLRTSAKHFMNSSLQLSSSTGLNDFGSGDYFMNRAAGQHRERHMVFGGGKSASEDGELGTTDDSTANAQIAQYLHSLPLEIFGSAGPVEFEVVGDWTGITCYTPDWLPLVGEAPEQLGLWMSIGMNGHGMAMAWRCAEALVHMIVEGKEPGWFPKPLRIARAWNAVC